MPGFLALAATACLPSASHPPALPQSKQLFSPLPFALRIRMREGEREAENGLPFHCPAPPINTRLTQAGRQNIFLGRICTCVQKESIGENFRFPDVEVFFEVFNLCRNCQERRSFKKPRKKVSLSIFSPAASLWAMCSSKPRRDRGGGRKVDGWILSFARRPQKVAGPLSELSNALALLHTSSGNFRLEGANSKVGEALCAWEQKSLSQAAWT